mmetsp:Transcript_18401/g.16438  ORF Transcript_18401/g.16438 Transcript_18401/m.16438 type:complete len:110 (-) Transcript_18401:230-559(-)|eukprot:CAMPEP_0201571436 /NCGR_PEP_ID=MMETSP0190_2-20130828/14199_1 /ASSEMBLY_ACC=CAM_ASM_000263 /TAXON_ID=37353 /ORGANISM="Rosalina sp." /LENGTH=109 /DNA_ID=CAMNT_0047996069 /DNA_START=72 /DNA_END=401 /DNA_ORIENTATION=+
MAAEAGDAGGNDPNIKYEKKILHTYNIAGKQIKDWMELTINDSVTNKTWYKKFTQNDFQTPIKEVYGQIKQANAEDKISFTYPDDDPDNGQLAMDCNGQFTINLPPKQI